MLRSAIAIAMCLLSVCLSVVCDVRAPYSQSERICMEFSGRIGNGPGKNQLNFGDDLPTGREVAMATIYHVRLSHL